MLELFFGVIDTVMSGDYFRIVLELGFCVAFMFGLQKIFEKHTTKNHYLSVLSIQMEQNQNPFTELRIFLKQMTAIVIFHLQKNHKSIFP